MPIRPKRKRRTWKDIEKKIKEICADELGLGDYVEEILLQHHFALDLNCDELDRMEFEDYFGEEFEVSIPETVSENWRTLEEFLVVFLRECPRESLGVVDVRILRLRLRDDHRVEVSLEFEDGSWTYADGTKLLPSRLYIPSFSKWTSVLKQLEELINDPKTKERDLQEFLEQYPELIAGDEYDEIIPQATITRDSKYSWAADFVLAPVNQNEFSKVLELKLPNVRSIKMPHNQHINFTGKVWDAINQLRDYGHAFDKPNVREKFKQAYNLDVYKPDLHLIIGRKWDFVNRDNEIYELKRRSEVKIEDWDSVVQKLKRRYC